MNEELKKLGTNLGSLALIAGAACLTFATGGELVKNIIGSVLTGKLSSTLDKIEIKKIQKLIDKPHPSELNHDLEKLITKALIWTIKNIDHLYKGYNLSKEQKSELKLVTESLINQIKESDNYHLINKDNIVQQIDNIEDEKVHISDFFNELDNLPEIKKEIPFPSFLKENFVKNFQLCFGELLKNKENNAALIAYNRNILNHIQKSIQNNQDKFIKELKASKDELKKIIIAVSDSKRRVLTTKKVDQSIILNIEQFTDELKNKIDILVDGQGNIISSLNIIDTKIDLLTGAVGKNDKNYIINKVVYVIATISVIAIGYLTYYYFQSKQSIIYTIEAENASKNEYLPLKGFDIKLKYGDKTEEIKTSDEAIFKNLPYSFKKDSIRIVISSYGFKTIDTTLLPLKNIISFMMHRDDTYKYMKGVVKDSSGKGIKDVLVSANNKTITTDNDGKFTFSFSEEEQKEEHRVTARAENYELWDYMQPVSKNENIIIRMQHD